MWSVNSNGHRHGQSVAERNGDSRKPQHLSGGVYEFDSSGCKYLYVEPGYRAQCHHGSHGERLSDCDNILYSNRNIRSGLYPNGNRYSNRQPPSGGDGELSYYLLWKLCDPDSSRCINLYLESGHGLECHHRGERQRVSDCDHILYSNGHQCSGLYGNGNQYGDG